MHGGMGIADRIFRILPIGKITGRLQNNSIVRNAVQDLGESQDADREGMGDGNPEGVLRSWGR